MAASELGIVDGIALGVEHVTHMLIGHEHTRAVFG
jgi:hypothetical protein